VNYYEQSIAIPSNGAYIQFYAEIHCCGDSDTSSTTAYFDNATFSSAASLWNQTYTYDQYGNINKSGSTSWNFSYDPATNHMRGGPTYDPDGHVLYDTTNTYSWDGYGKMTGVRTGNNAPSCGSTGSYCATYDALGRIVETSNGSVYREILYGPTGRLAQMNGQSTVNAYIPLPGGLALYASAAGGGTRYIQHPDWLGSKRLSTSLGNRAQVFDTAYSPFGEAYDSFGTVKPDFTGDLQDIFPGAFDTPNRELATNASRWLSPDPAGIAGAGPFGSVTDVTRPNLLCRTGGQSRCRLLSSPMMLSNA